LTPDASLVQLVCAAISYSFRASATLLMLTRQGPATLHLK
jgi:hypothetical protein